jgi:putative effector of murein hydrolase LrgA (UPF0299 family)
VCFGGFEAFELQVRWQSTLAERFSTNLCFHGLFNVGLITYQCFFASSLLLLLLPSTLSTMYFLGSLVQNWCRIVDLQKLAIFSIYHGNQGTILGLVLLVLGLHHRDFHILEASWVVGLPRRLIEARFEFCVANGWWQ